MVKTIKLKIITIAIIINFLLITPTSFSAINTQIKDNKLNDLYGKKYAIIIGLNNYNNSTIELHRPLKIAENIYKSLINQTDWLQENMKLLTDKNATKKNIINALNQLKNSSTNEDIIVFTFAGHGSTVKDTNGDEKFDQAMLTYDQKYIIDEEFNDIISEIKAKGFFIVIDSCFSGGFNEIVKNKNMLKETRKSNNFIKDFLSSFSKEKNKVVLMSCLPAYPTWSIITNKDGRIAVSDGVSRAIKNGKTTAEDISKFTRNWWYSHPEAIFFNLLFLIGSLNPILIYKQIKSYISNGQFMFPMPTPFMIDNYPGKLKVIEN